MGTFDEISPFPSEPMHFLMIIGAVVIALIVIRWLFKGEKQPDE